MNWVEFGSKVRAARISKNLTQHELAKAIGVTAVSISYYESGRKKPSFDKIKLICSSLSLSMEEL